MTTREIADAIGKDTANAWNVLRRLEAKALVNLISDSRSQRWQQTDLGCATIETVLSSSSASG